MNKHREYFNKIAAQWDQKLDLRPEDLQPILSRLEVKEGERVLDVGCGTGVLLPYLLQLVGESGQVVGLDIAEKMLAMAREKIRAQNLTLHRADAARTDLAPASFQHIICFSVFPHFKDQFKVTKELSRLLTTRGQLVVAHAAGRKSINQLHRELGKPVSEDLLPEAATMRNLIRKAGLRLLQLTDQKGLYFLQAEKTAVS